MARKSKVELLIDWGLIVGDRDHQRNTAFKGRFMVAEPISDPALLPTIDARRGGYCVVGDNLPALIETAFSWFGQEDAT